MLCARDGSGGRISRQLGKQPPAEDLTNGSAVFRRCLNRWASQASSETERAGRLARFSRRRDAWSAPCCPGAGSRDTAARTPVCIVRATPRAQASRRASEARAHARERRERRANRAFEGARFPRRGSFRETHRASRARASRVSPTPTRSRWGTRRLPRSRRRSTECSATRRCGCARARRDASHPRRLRATLFPPSPAPDPLHVAPLADPAPLDAGRHARPRRRGQDHHPL